MTRDVRAIAAFALALAAARVAPAQDPLVDENVAEGIVVKLVKAGEPPLAPLRYRVRPGAVEFMAVEMKMRMSMEIGEQKASEEPFPTVSMVMKIQPTALAPDGDLTYEFETTEISVGDDTTMPAPFLKVIKSDLAAMKGMSGSAIVSDRGLVRRSTVRTPPNAPERLKDFSENIRQSMKQFAAPLPEEPVGVGAVWIVATPVRAGGMKMTQVAEYVVLGIENGRYVLDVAVKQSAARQAMQPPGLPEGAKMFLESMEGAGNGRVALDLGRLAVESNLAMRSASEMVVSAGDQTQPMKMTTGLEMKYVPK